MSRSFCSQGFVIHRHHYRETSRILRCVTLDYGRIDLVCKGCRGQGKAAKVVEPFRLYEFEWSGKSELKTLRQADEIRVYSLGRSQYLYSGFYLNELLNHLLQAGEAEPDIFHLYMGTLMQLQDVSDNRLPVILRYFELRLLDILGYGINLKEESDGRTPIDVNAYYGFDIREGFYRVQDSSQALLQGDTIASMRTGHYHQKRHIDEARMLMRFVLQFYMPSDKIQSRKLFI